MSTSKPDNHNGLISIYFAKLPKTRNNKEIEKQSYRLEDETLQEHILRLNTIALGLLSSSETIQPILAPLNVAERLCESLEQPQQLSSQAVTWNNMACAYNRFHMSKSAYSYLMKTLQNELASGDSKSICSTYSNISSTLNSLGRHTDALKYSKISLYMFDKLVNSQDFDCIDDLTSNVDQLVKTKAEEFNQYKHSLYKDRLLVTHETNDNTNIDNDQNDIDIDQDYDYEKGQWNSQVGSDANAKETSLSNIKQQLDLDSGDPTSTISMSMSLQQANDGSNGFISPNKNKNKKSNANDYNHLHTEGKSPTSASMSMQQCNSNLGSCVNSPSATVKSKSKFTFTTLTCPTNVAKYVLQPRVEADLWPLRPMLIPKAQLTAETLLTVFNNLAVQYEMTGQKKIALEYYFKCYILCKYRLGTFSPLSKKYSACIAELYAKYGTNLYSTKSGKKESTVSISSPKNKKNLNYRINSRKALDENLINKILDNQPVELDIIDGDSRKLKSPYKLPKVRPMTVNATRPYRTDTTKERKKWDESIRLLSPETLQEKRESFSKVADPKNFLRRKSPSVFFKSQK